MRSTSLRRVDGGRLSLNHLAGALHCRKIRAHRWKERLRSICDAPYLTRRRKETERGRARHTFELWSYQKIASLLASQRLRCSHPSFFETRSNILLVLCVRSLYFSCESTTRIFFRVFSPLSVSFFRILRNEDRISTVFVLPSWWTSVGGLAIVRMCFFWVV